jgi:hypothetical protein
MTRVSLQLDDPDDDEGTPDTTTTTTGGTGTTGVAGAATTAPPAPVLPETPQLPYAADAGSYTKIWQEQNIGITLDATKAEITEFLANYDGTTRPDYAIIEDSILSSCRNLSFLTIMKDHRVGLLHSIGKYSSGLGKPTPAHRRIFGLIGEKIGTELPPSVMAPSSGLKDWIKTQDLYEPTDAYIKGLKDSDKMILAIPPVPLNDDEEKVSVMTLCYLPRVWAPYFLKETSPYDAWLMSQKLLAQLPPAARPSFDYLEGWLKIACTGTEKSQLCAAWQGPYMDREQRKWMQNHTASLNAVSSMLPNSPALPPTGGPTLSANEIFLKTLETVQTLKPPTETKKYSPLERQRLRACCNLSVMQFETEGLPAFHRLLLAEGRSAKGTASALTASLKANPGRGDPGLIFISPELTKDIKECNYGYGGDKSYGNCHRGISPFSVPHMSLRLQQERRTYQDRLAQASHVTLTDVAKGESAPVVVPSGYGDLLRLLSNYIRLVTTVAGTRSSHGLELVEIQTILRAQPDTYGDISQQQNAYILWAIFKDARWFFSQSVEPGDPLPTSTLRYVTSFMNAGRLPLDQIDVPPELLTSPRPRPVDRPAPRAESRSDDLFPGAKPDYVPVTNDSVPDDISAITGPLMEKFPDANVGDLLRGGAKFEDLRMGKRGTCMNYNLLGVCSEPDCRYQHNKSKPAAAKAKSIAEKLRPVVDDLISGGHKRKR